jgi:hypothetical protein
MNNPDINIADLDITYDVTNPVNVSGTYGTDWELIDASMTSGGTADCQRACCLHQDWERLRERTRLLQTIL